MSPLAASVAALRRPRTTTVRLRQPRLIAAAMLAAATAVLAGASTPAQAGTYKVYSCSTPAGTPAPITGWAPLLEVPQQAIATSWMTINQCTPQSRLVTTLPSLTGLTTWKAGERAGWRYTAPAGTQITRVEARRVFSLMSLEESGRVYAQLSAAGGRTERCETPGCEGLGSPLQQSRPENVSNFEAAGTTFTLETGCAGAAGQTCDAINDRSIAEINRATFFLRDDSSPTATAVAGTLLEAGARRGIESLAFTAEDLGAGVRRVELSVDGKQVNTAAPDPIGACVDAGFDASEDEEYLQPVPCAPSLPVAVGVDTRLLADGPHAVRAVATDGSGNEAVVLERAFTVDNTTPPATPTPATPPADGIAPIVVRLDSPTATRKVAYGKRLQLRGVVLDAASKAPRPGVALTLTQRVLRTGGATSTLPAVVTGADGRFAIDVPTTASRLVQLQAPGVLLDVRVLVSAKLTLAAPPAVIPRGSTLRLAGKVSVDGLPKRGVRVEIQSRWGGRWRTVDSVQTSKTGAWRWRYRVERATGKLPFRAVLVATGELAAADGISRVVNVRVR